MAGVDGIDWFLGLGFIVDTNVIDDESPASAALRAHASAGRIRLSRTDVVDTELAGAPPEKRAQLLQRSAELDEYLGPLVLDHSRLGYAVVGGAADEERLERVFRVLHPGGDRQKPGSHDLRDAMHVATAIRYGADGFITLDKGSSGSARRSSRRSRTSPCSIRWRHSSSSSGCSSVRDAGRAAGSSSTR